MAKNSHILNAEGKSIHSANPELYHHLKKEWWALAVLIKDLADRLGSAVHVRGTVNDFVFWAKSEHGYILAISIGTTYQLAHATIQVIVPRKDIPRWDKNQPGVENGRILQNLILRAGVEELQASQERREKVYELIALLYPK